jgi:hypothetical protein
VRRSYLRASHVSLEPVGQAVAAAAVIGLCVGGLVLISRGLLWPQSTRRHRIFVDLYASPIGDSTATSDGYYQARCRCGWRSGELSIDLDTAETDAADEGERHLREAAEPVSSRRPA